ncbi:Chaperone DnaJ-domain superfamily protein [Abeliophyllum distichum]|uniref:Chaperone DnaJ-domain superfamily protein n=1 Tax=Abeliophyllum distichum TaxID=126358 RepID=A0ABD1PQM8_9LAMI
MNRVSRAASIVNYEAKSFQLRASLFHSTPFLGRRRRTNWDSRGTFRGSSKRFNQYSKRPRKQALLYDVSEFAEHLFRSWQSNSDEYHESSSQGSSWFRPHFRDDRCKRGKSGNRRSGTWRNFDFCEDDDREYETIFRSAYGGNQYFGWSFITDDDPRYWKSSCYTNKYKTSSGWKYQYCEEYDSEYEKEYDSDSSSDSEKSEADMMSQRLALGLSTLGSLNLEDVKNAYRECALKWHPDRHQGSSKVVAEEKFKVCSAAYQSLCDKLAL